MLTMQPSDGYEKYLTDLAFKKSIPLSGTFELLSACNMNCKMCYVRTSWDEMLKHGQLLSVDKWVQIAQECKENGTLFLLLTGGEPLMYPGFKELYKRISQLGIILTINTNGTLITNEIIDLWKEYPPRRVNVSLYGSSNETYKELCDNPKGFDQTISAIRKMLESNIQVKVNYTINEGNYKDLDEIIKISNDLGVPVSTPTYMFPPVRKDNKSFGKNLYRLSVEKATTVQSRIIREAIIEGLSSKESIQDMLDRINYRESLSYDDNVPGGFLCTAGVSSFWVTWKGLLTPCGMMPYPAKDLTQFKFSEAWDYVKESSKLIKTSTKCFNCKYRKICKNCGAISFAETGKTNNEVSWHCDLCEKYENELKKIVEEFSNENK